MGQVVASLVTYLVVYICHDAGPSGTSWAARHANQRGSRSAGRRPRCTASCATACATSPGVGASGSSLCRTRARYWKVGRPCRDQCFYGEACPGFDTPVASLRGGQWANAQFLGGAGVGGVFGADEDGATRWENVGNWTWSLSMIGWPMCISVRPIECLFPSAVE